MSIYFYSKSKDVQLRMLSNFYEMDIEYNGNLFKTGEHLFHFEKYMLAYNNSNNLKRKNLLINHANKFIGDYFKSPLDAKRAAGKGKQGLKLSERELSG